MQIKNTIRYHFIPVRDGYYHKDEDNKCWGEYRMHCWKVGKLVAHTGVDGPWRADVGEAAEEARIRSGRAVKSTPGSLDCVCWDTGSH